MGMSDDLYQQLLPKLTLLEQERKKSLLNIRRTLWFSALISFLGGIIMVWSTYLIIGLFWWLALIIFVLIGLFIGRRQKNKAYKAFRMRYKTKVIQTILNHVNSDLWYDAGAKLAKREFVESRLFEHVSLEEYHGEDLIKGRIGKTHFRLSEIHSKQKEARIQKENGPAQHLDVFKGLFIIIELDKEFLGNTFVMPRKIGEDKPEWMTKMFAQHFPHLNGEFITLNQQLFETYFLVYSSDVEESFQILSEGMIQDLLLLREFFGTNIRISFLGSKAHLAISSFRDFMEPDPYEDLTQSEQFQEFYEEVKLILQIIEKLDNRLMSESR